jgi:ParB/RepB/Spo0J family partition protein
MSTDNKDVDAGERETATVAKPVRKARGVGFAAMQAFMNEAAEPKLSATAPIGSPLESPAFRRMTADRKEPKSAGFVLTLPISKQALEMTYMELDPRLCVPSPLNPRDQSLLSLQDPDVARIKESFEREGQREPVKARVISGAGSTQQWEVVEGTTRLFIARALTEEQGTVVPLKAWVGPIPDADVRRLAKAENRDRRDLSAWETARALREDTQQLYKGRTQEYIAEQEGWSQTQVSNLLKLAELDERLLKLVASPSHISLTAGLQLVAQWAEIADTDRVEAIATLAGGVPFADATAVVKALKSYKAQQAAAAAKREKGRAEVVQAKNGEVVARLSPHRTNIGQYKLDMFAFSPAEASKIMEYIRKLKGG